MSGNVDKTSKYKAYLRLIKNPSETPVAKSVASLKRVREIEGEGFLVSRGYCACDLSSKYCAVFCKNFHPPLGWNGKYITLNLLKTNNYQKKNRLFLPKSVFVLYCLDRS